MKQTKIIKTLILGAFFLALLQTTVFADLTASGIRDQFNGMNGGEGLKFHAFMGSGQYYGDYSGETRIQAQLGTEVPDLSAYVQNVTSGSNYFQTFCVEPEEILLPGMGADNTGKLSYSNGYTQTSTYLQKMNLGVAYLYKAFAAGELSNYTYAYGSGRANNAVLLQDAIWFLLGKGTDVLINDSTSWTNNKFLQLLSSINSNQSFWTADYNLDADYGTLMSDYKVFVMTTIEARPTGTGGFGIQSLELYRQDLLYVRRSGEAATPEPATILLWGLGSCGAFGFAAYRRARAKQAV